MSYKIVSFEYWYGAKSKEGHNFIQVLDEDFETRKEAQKRLEELKKLIGEDDAFLKYARVMNSKKVRKHREEDEEYMNGFDGGCWGFPKPYAVVCEQEEECYKEYWIDYYNCDYLP